MKIVNIIGGLGNQMFQYAFALALQKEYPDTKVKLNKSCFRGYKLHNGYELDKIFNILLPYANIKDLIRYAYPWVNYNLWRLKRFLPVRKSMAADRDFRPTCDLTLAANKSYFDGYWQSPKYFEKYRDLIIRAFKMPKITDERNLRAVNFIKRSKTAFIHIRRGDYMNHPILGGICTDTYYSNAINILRQNYGYDQFIIFSNDIGWCRQNFTELCKQGKVMFVDWNSGESSYRDIQLMSYCKAGIVANSSFSWWGGWLAEAEVILCPIKWAAISGDFDKIIPNNWIRVDIN